MADTARKPFGQRKQWLQALLAAVLWHLVVLVVGPPLLPRPSRPPLQIEVTQIEPSQLESIRRPTTPEERRQRQLLLNRDPSRPRDATPPPNARFESDRNIRVEKEQRARDTDVVPQPRTQAGPKDGADAARPARPRSEGRERAVSPPNLAALGLPLAIGRARSEPEAEQQARGQERDSAGADQAITDDTLPVGSENLLNAQESVYYSFYARIAESVGPLWKSKLRESAPRQQLSQGDYMTTVDVTLDANGRVVDISTTESSGIPEFDRAVHVTWEKLARFPNPPRDLLDDRGQVHIGYNFIVQITDGAGIQFQNPRRVY